MLLLHDAGISMPDVFRIATLESARGIGHGAEYGSIEAGKRADMILFDGDPLREPRDLLGGKTTIKDGVVYRAADTYGASGATLVTDSAEYTVRFVKPFYRARIGFAYTNHTGDAVSANMCHGPTPPTLEKEVSPGGWVVAYSPFLQLCRSEPPFRVVAEQHIGACPTYWSRRRIEHRPGSTGRLHRGHVPSPLGTPRRT